MQLAAPGERRAPAENWGREGPERLGGASRSPRPYPGLGRVQLFPGECGVRSALPQGPKSPQSPAGWAAVWRLCQRFHDKTRRKKIRIKSPRCCHPLEPAFVEESGGEPAGHGEREGVWCYAVISDPKARRGGGEVTPCPQGTSTPPPSTQDRVIFVLLSKDSPA